MAAEFLTTPWQNQERQTVLQELRRQGYNVEQSNGETIVKIGDKSYKVDLNKPVWTIMAEIGQIEAENKREEIKQDAQARANEYHQMYEEKMEDIKKTKEERNIFLALWEGARDKVKELLNQYNAKDVRDITNTNDKERAIQYSDVATENKFKLIGTGNKILSDCNDALSYALREGEWSTIAVC